MRKVILFLFLAGPLLSFDLTPDDPRYMLLEELRVRGLMCPLHPHSRPYRESNLAGYLLRKEDPFGRKLYNSIILPYIDRRKSSTFDLWLRPIADTVTTFYFGFGGGAHIGGLEFYVSPFFHFGDDSLYPRGKWIETIYGEYERGYFALKKGPIQAILGRERFSFGPSPRYNLLLSGRSFPMDGIYLAYEKGPIKYILYNAKLDDWVADSDFAWGKYRVKRGEVIKRYFSLHRLELFLFKRLLLTATDAIIYGGPDRSPELFYMNPFFLNWPYQLLRGTDDNPIVNIEARLYMGKFSAYGEFLIDDLQTSHSPVKEPNEVGFTLGLEAADPLFLKKTFFIGEYTRVYRWTYNQLLPWNKPLFLGDPMGHPLGSDFDQFYAEGIYHLNEIISVRAFFEHTRDGEGDMFEPWPDSLFPAENFLTGTVEKRTNAGMGFLVLLPEGYADFEIYNAGIKNRHHIAGNTENFVGFRLRMKAHASTERMEWFWNLFLSLTGWK